MSTNIELPCYTLIHTLQDGEQATELKLKEDLEKGDNKVCLLNRFNCLFSRLS